MIIVTIKCATKQEDKKNETKFNFDITILND